MERRINSKISFFITMAAGVYMATGTVSARPFEAESSSGGCQQAEKILHDLRNEIEHADSLTPFAMNSPIKEQRFEVHWLETHGPDLENIDQEETDPDNITQPIRKNRNSDLQQVTVALSRSVTQTGQIDQEETDPDNTPKPSTPPPAGGSLTSIEMVLFETASSHGVPRRLEGCALWKSPSINSIEQEETDPDNTPKETSSLQSSWLRFSLPPHLTDDLAEGRRGREDLLWWLLGLVEVMSTSR